MSKCAYRKEWRLWTWTVLSLTVWLRLQSGCVWRRPRRAVPSWPSESTVPSLSSLLLLCLCPVSSCPPLSASCSWPFESLVKCRPIWKRGWAWLISCKLKFMWFSQKIRKWWDTRTVEWRMSSKWLGEKERGLWLQGVAELSLVSNRCEVGKI